MRTRQAPVPRWLLAATLLLAAGPALAARDVLLVLDNSGSMRKNDPSRLAGPAVMEFIQAQPPDTRVGIVLFTSDPDLVMPLTPAEVAADGAAQRALRQFNYSGQWTQTAGAIERALYELRTEGRPEARRVIVLMTDGIIDTGDARRDADYHEWLRRELAQKAARDKIGIFGVAFTERADYQLLQSLASATDAEYFRVLNASGIGKALQGIESALSASAAPAAPEPAPVAPPPAEPVAQAAPAETAPAEAVPAGPPRRSLAWLWWTLALALAGVAGFTAWWWLRHRQAPAGDPDTARVRKSDEVPLRSGGPQALLYDNMERHEIGEKPVVVGRAGGTDPSRYYLIVPEKTVGRWHATIERRGQTFWLRDEGSVNGTFLNGERIVGERPLKHRDTIRFHNHTFEFEIPELSEFDRTVMQPGQRAN